MNNAIRFIYNLKRTDHITEFQFKLHVLPIIFRVRFKLSLIAYKIARGLAPHYFNDIYDMYSPTTAMSLRPGRGRDTLMLTVCNDRSLLFSKLTSEWNSLSLELRSTNTIDLFKRKLKTFYFRQAFPDYVT